MIMRKPFQVGMIHRDEVDLSPCSFYLTAERKEVVDFSVTLDYAELVLHFFDLFYFIRLFLGTNFSLSFLEEILEDFGVFSNL